MIGARLTWACVMSRTHRWCLTARLRWSLAAHLLLQVVPHSTHALVTVRSEARCRIPCVPPEGRRWCEVSPRHVAKVSPHVCPAAVTRRHLKGCSTSSTVSMCFSPLAPGDIAVDLMTMMMMKVTVTVTMIMSRMMMMHACMHASEDPHDPEARRQGVTLWRLLVTLAWWWRQRHGGKVSRFGVFW